MYTGCPFFKLCKLYQCRFSCITNCLSPFCMGWARMMRDTAEIMSIKPKAMVGVKGSAKTRMPMLNAVRGSMAPNIAVSVDPMFLMAYTSARFETTVGNMASMRMFMKAFPSGILCTPPFSCAFSKKIREPYYS